MNRLVERAEAARTELENCITDLLSLHQEGLRNSQIAKALCLESDFNGRQRNYLTYSLLGGLIWQRKVDFCKNSKLFTLSKSR